MYIQRSELLSLVLMVILVCILYDMKRCILYFHELDAIYLSHAEALVCMTVFDVIIVYTQILKYRR